MLQKQQIIVPLGMNETSERCSSFVMVPKVNSKVRFCLDSTRLNKAFTRPVHKNSTLNDILQKLAGKKYLTLIDASLGYHNLKLDKRSSYLTMFSCAFGGYRYIRLSFRLASWRHVPEEDR